jgi:hypothetical protein
MIKHMRIIQLSNKLANFSLSVKAFDVQVSQHMNIFHTHLNLTLLYGLCEDKIVL